MRRSKHTRTHVYIYNINVLDTMRKDERSEAVQKDLEYLPGLLIIQSMNMARAREREEEI